MNLKKTICCLLIITLMITLFISSASAASADYLSGSIEKSSFTKGEYVMVGGIAEGANHISCYLISSVSGYNDYFQMNTNNNYEYIFSIDTSELAAGEYYLIIQHPYSDGKDGIRMNNGVLYYFDVNRATYNQLVGYEGARVITNLIEHQSNDDIHVLLRFTVNDVVSNTQAQTRSVNNEHNSDENIKSIIAMIISGIIVACGVYAGSRIIKRKKSRNNYSKVKSPLREPYDVNKVESQTKFNTDESEESKSQNNDSEKSEDKLNTDYINMYYGKYNLDSFSDIEVDNSPESNMNNHINPDTSTDDDIKSDSCENKCENKCNSCGKENPEDAIFCKYCGAKL